MSRWGYTVAHCQAGQRNPWVVRVCRTFRRASLLTAIKKAAQIRRAGYLAWVEKTGQEATR